MKNVFRTYALTYLFYGRHGKSGITFATGIAPIIIALRYLSCSAEPVHFAVAT